MLIHRQCLIWKETYLIYSYLPSCWHGIRVDTLKKIRGMHVGLSDGGHRNSNVVCVKYKLFAALSCLVFGGYHIWISALVIQHAKRTRLVIFPSVTCPAVTYVSTLSHQRYDPRGKNILNTKCVFWFSLQFLSENNLILWRIKRNILIVVYVFLLLSMYSYRCLCILLLSMYS